MVEAPDCLYDDEVHRVNGSYKLLQRAQVKPINEMMCKQNCNFLRQFINSLNPIPSDKTGSYIFHQSKQSSNYVNKSFTKKTYVQTFVWLTPAGGAAWPLCDNTAAPPASPAQAFPLSVNAALAALCL